MKSQMATTTRSPVPSTPRSQPQNTPQSTNRPRPLPFKRNLSETGPVSSCPAHTQSAPALSAYTPPPPGARPSSAQQRPSAVQSGRAESTGAPEQPSVTRGYTVHMPHNPSRPPPYTYQRQHEFPPFPPLAQHPVLPFLTTAFAHQPLAEAPAAPPPKPRVIITPRASTTQRHVQSNLSTIPTMDVSKSDPTATFIRLPLVVPLPRNGDSGIRPEVLSGNSSDGDPAPGTPLTYAILHHHRDWFLDAEDFRKDNPNRLDYPPDLEPPRGWAPLAECTGAGAAGRCKEAKETKEKNSRTKGFYAHGENAVTDTTVEYGPSDDCHEKTVLRCTFCRREYHGPNAKSMWRRHVYDKHKVAMKNRREGSAGMAPKVPLPKKGKAKAATRSPPLDTPGPTLDLADERNLIRLLERVVSGNLDINLPASLLSDCSSSDGCTHGINLETIAFALQNSGISLALEKGAISSVEQSADNEDIANSCEGKRQTWWNPGQKEWRNTGSPNEVRGVEDNHQSPRSLDRSTHNSNTRVIPGTPRKDKGKHKATPRTPGSLKVSKPNSPISSSPQNPYTPRCLSATALRARALATTGQESYLTLVLSSPGTASPVRSTSRISFTSPFRRSPTKANGAGVPSSDDPLGILGTSSPRYPFDFNIEGTQSSHSYLATYDSIPLESRTLTPERWTPPALGPPAPVSEPTSRSISRASSVTRNMEADEDQEPVSDDDDQDMELHYLEWSPPPERLKRRGSRLLDADFDMEAFLDLDDAAPALGANVNTSPQRSIVGRGFSKEFGLLSPEEVERITASACLTFEEEARSSKRQKVDS